MPLRQALSRQELQINNRLLKIDGIINLGLGLLLGLYPEAVIRLLGLPLSEVPFYASILGAVLFGIGIALFVEVSSPGMGLGLIGAISINICGGLCLGAWLLWGNLYVPLTGLIVMWSLVAVLLGISSIELMAILKKNA
jgi:hypothetical protein